jgi:hypothetical protein
MRSVTVKMKMAPIEAIRQKIGEFRASCKTQQNRHPSGSRGPETLEKPLMKLPEVSFSLKPRPWTWRQRWIPA